VTIEASSSGESWEGINNRGEKLSSYRAIPGRGINMPETEVRSELEALHRKIAEPLNP